MTPHSSREAIPQAAITSEVRVGEERWVGRLVNEDFAYAPQEPAGEDENWGECGRDGTEPGFAGPLSVG